jgi:hypothetical protein
MQTASIQKAVLLRPCVIVHTVMAFTFYVPEGTDQAPQQKQKQKQKQKQN